MPDQYVKLPDGSYAQFPDSMSDAEIQTALVKNGLVKPSPPAVRQETLVDKAVDLLPVAGAGLGGFLGGAGGTAFGFGFGGVPGAVGGATLGGAAGEAGKELINRFRGVETPATSAEAARAIGTQGAVQGALEATGQAAMPVIGKAATAIYRGYLKPSLAKSSIREAQQVVQTALDEGLPITKGGMEKGRAIIGDLNAKVKGMLAKQGNNIDLQAIADDVRTWAADKYYKPGVPSADYEAALKVADSIDKHASLNLPPGVKTTRVGVSEQAGYDTKKALQTAVGEGYGTERGATLEAQKRGAYAARKAVEAAKPDIAPLTARESKLIDSVQAINRAVEREANQYVIQGVKGGLSGIVGYGEYRRTGDPWEAAAVALGSRLAQSPAVVSRAAIVASQLAKANKGFSPAQIARIVYAGLDLAPTALEEK